MSARSAVANPILLTPDEALPAFQFVALNTYSPRGQVTEPDSGVTLHTFPSYTEVIGRYCDRNRRPIDLWWCVNRMPVVDTDFEILAACIDVAPAGLFHVLVGRDHGDALARILARDWPDIHAMLAASTAGDLDRRLLLAVETTGGQQWMVADVIKGRARHEISARQVEDLIVTALSVAIRTSDWVVQLPGILELGPDLKTRQLRGIAGLLSGIGDIGGATTGAMQGSLTPQDLSSAMDAAKSLPGHLRAVFR